MSKPGRILSWMLTVSYQPDETARQFQEQAHEQDRNGLQVRVAIPSAEGCRKFFGVSVCNRGIQPIWIEIANDTEHEHRLQAVALDPDYFSPLEAAAANHFSGVRRFVEFGFLALIHLPLVLLLGYKLWAVRRANRRMDAFFREHAFRMRPVPAKGKQSGFVFANRTEGTKIVLVRLMGHDGTQDFEFSIPVSGLKVDHLHKAINDQLSNASTCKDLLIDQLNEYLLAAPATTTNRSGKRMGDPVNLVVVGNFSCVLGAFGARWDETEVVSLGSCWRTVKSFLIGAEYRYSPVSPLYLFGRSQDFALQRARGSINERLHLRLWATPMRYDGARVWIGQVSRDIGVRLTWRTWNLTTHRIDPDVDEARDYIVEDLIHAGRLRMGDYVEGVGACARSAPRHNLTGDPYHTDGQRAVVVLSEDRTTPQFLGLP